MRVALILLVVQCAAAQQLAVRLRLATADGRTEFRIGERIPVALIFESTGSQTFQISKDTGMRRLRPQGQDEFTATPATGWADPLAWLPWTADGWGGSMMHRDRALLDVLHPVRIERDLNEFIVFRSPGRYILHAVSSRVEGAAKPVASNDLELRILPRDDAWTARQFAAAKITLEAGKPPKEPERTIYTDKENAQVDAVRTLRYLETESAARYLVSIYGSGRRSDSEIEYALLASPYSEAILDQYERDMADPGLAISQTYLGPFIEVGGQLKERQLGHKLSPADWKQSGDALDKRVFELAAGKNPQAKADTYYYLYLVGTGYLRGNAEVLDRLVTSLPSASPWVVAQFLSMNWGSIGAAQAHLEPFLKQAITRTWPLFGFSVNGMALLCLAQVDAQAAASIASRELLSGEFAIGDSDLFELPLPSSPALDQALLAQYRQSKPVEGRIARYASAAIKDDLWRIWTARPPASGERQSCLMFAYFFRVDPTAAAGRLADLRQDPGGACTALDFGTVERRLMSPGLERQLIADARSPDGNIQSAAFQMLAAGGSHADLPVLLDAIDAAQASRRNRIATVLNARSWVLMDADCERLAKACVGTDLCPEVERARREALPPYTIRPFDSNGHNGVWLANHEMDTLDDLAAALAQFPAGATFRWEEQGQETHEKVRALLAARGFLLLN